MVLPEAEPEGDAEDDQTDNDPRAELIEVLDEGEAILVGYRPDPGHRCAQLRSCTAVSPSSACLEGAGGSISPRRGSGSVSPGCGSESSSRSPPSEPRNSRMPF